MTDAFAAAAEPTRRRILQLLASGPHYAGDIAGYFDVTRSAISQHLGVLADSGLVAAERQGRQRLYRIDPSGIARLQARNAQRKSGRRMTSPASAEILELSTTVHAAPASVGPESDGWITWLLSHLPERERQVLACLDVVGLDVRSTCAALDMSATAVRVAHHRGLRRLRGLGVVVSR